MLANPKFSGSQTYLDNGTPAFSHKIWAQPSWIIQEFLAIQDGSAWESQKAGTSLVHSLGIHSHSLLFPLCHGMP